ncbi:WYL domain-containing protein [Brevibacillus brevis]|uniref:WYL domain-containing protein n=1 Tax=Brevibacillus brevis TaxID=1393 RepID=A0ABY9TC51_BREBE|nr:WYL domain-containing protein [Brevibacillus brevis]WNC17508.1 WYL domain-containing protein [Brevibacillus brevis]
MAKESFDKEIQFLRMLFLTSGAYNRQQFARRLGISVHTFDKTIRRLKDVFHTIYKDSADPLGSDMTQLVKSPDSDSSDPALLFLFRAKSLKESESFRLSAILTALQEQAMTAAEVLEACCNALPAEMPLPDEKTIRSDLKYLEEVGAIARANAGRPVRYSIRNELINALTDEELTDLYDFVDVMANTQVPSVQGYLLRDQIKRARIQRNSFTEHLVYKYHYHSRILDEAHLYSLFHAIRHRRRIRFRYFSPKLRQSYDSKNTNPLFEKESAGKQELVLPLKVVYDHQYGRWYLLGDVPRLGIVKYRMEGLTQIEEADAVSELEFSGKLRKLEESIRYSWLVDTGRQVLVRVRFYNPPESRSNFIKERVLLQGQWGMITEEDEGSFVYEITVNGTTEIKPWLRSFGSSCEVLEPAYLRREFIAEWKEIQSYYESFRENL